MLLMPDEIFEKYIDDSFRAVNNLTCPQRYKNVLFNTCTLIVEKTSATLAKPDNAFTEALVSLSAYVECRLADFVSLPTLL